VLYLITLAVLLIWMVMLLGRKKLSWHSILTAYVMSVVSIDVLEVLFNLLLKMYSFPTHLLANPLDDNQLGIIFADTLILPFAYIIFVHFAVNSNPWRISIPFAAAFTVLERIYLHLGYLEYHHWSTWLSAGVYVIGFRIGAELARPIVSYRPPVPYWLRLIAVGHTTNMWVGAILGLPVLKLYQFHPGLFVHSMADDRFVDLASGLVLAVFSAVLVPRTPGRLKPVILAVLAGIGASFSYYCFLRGWLTYHYWSHSLMVLRYAIPFLLMMLYDRWELPYERLRSRI